jgi:CelD/BcsL family acetyltransferase involved in cellulose biosynthesis
LTWEWHDLWWRQLGEGDLHLLAIQAGDELVGIAPLARVGDTWGFTGGAEVADFLDVIALPDHAADVAVAVLDYLGRQGGEVELRNLRPDSVVASALVPEARRRGPDAILEREDVAPRIVLPPTWDDYLQQLSRKDRHELRRKLRRLMGSGEVAYGPVTEVPGPRDLADFTCLLRRSAERKATFMTDAMEGYFGAILAELAPRGWARLYFLTIDGRRVAGVILFDYRDEFLLYNSGYDPTYAHLSVGLLLKAFCLRDAITEGRRAFDFLQGDEPYKYDLGGVDVPIYRLRLAGVRAEAAVCGGARAHG